MPVKYLVKCIFISFFIFSCQKENKVVKNQKPYTGPLAQLYNINTLFSDSALVKVQLIAPVQNEYINGDRIFPKGLLLYFFDKTGNTNSSLKANHGKVEKSTGIYTATGNVVINDLKEGKKMNTELLNWNPTTKKVYTDKFVRIETKEEILTGNGLEATQDFKYYKILNPTGVFSVKQP